MDKPFRIYQDIYIIGSAEISHPYDCCLYLIDVGELILIDSGAGRSFKRLVDNILALGLEPEKISTVVVTHCHIDHVGSLANFKQKYGARIIAHTLDAEAIETGRGTGAELYGVAYKPCQVDVKLQGTEQKLVFGGQEFTAIHIPGHTKGSIALYTDMGGKRILFGQDIHGPYEPMWGGEPGKAIISLQKLIDLKSDILCEGHFGIYQPADEVKDYIEEYLYQLQRATRKY
jgi:glyoxylase-like metal-dependent hydrolase (beta-lactamase superfamily II)